MINKDNIEFIYKNEDLKDKDNYQNVVIIDKSIKKLLQEKVCGIMKKKRKLMKGGQ